MFTAQYYSGTAKYIMARRIHIKSYFFQAAIPPGPVRRSLKFTTILFSVFLIFSSQAHSQLFDTLHIYFPLDKNELTADATKYIDSLIHKKVIAPGKKITLMGYGDYLGSDGYNENLSYSRAKNLQDYLTVTGFNKQDIKLCVGKGKINSPARNGNKGNSKDRKVEIIIDKIIDTPAAEKFNYALINLKDKETYPVYDIHFFQGSLGITPQSQPYVKMLYNFLNAHNSYIIQLEGHICCIGPAPGDEPYDESTLSMKRAELIRDSLVHYGIDSARIKCMGLGNHNLIYDEVTDPENPDMPPARIENSEMSRRVEIRILKR